MLDADLVPMKLLRKYAREYPRAWRILASMRRDRGDVIPWWPDWCYCPIAGGVAIVTEGENVRMDAMVEIFKDYQPDVLVALAAWRVTKGVYCFDPSLMVELLEMPLEGNLPVDVFYRLPEWSVYIQTPGLNIMGDIDGFFTFLEYDAKNGEHELRLVFVYANLGVKSVIIHLGDWTLEEALRVMEEDREEALRLAGVNEGFLTADEQEEFYRAKANIITPFLNLVIYLCSENADLPARPVHPSRIPTKKGKIQTAQEVRRWDVGVREGAALKRNGEGVRAEGGAGSEEGRSSPRPHYRRAHWHHYWTGPRDKPEDRKLIVKWLPPTLVGVKDVDGDNRPMVIRRIE